MSKDNCQKHNEAFNESRYDKAVNRIKTGGHLTYGKIEESGIKQIEKKLIKKLCTFMVFPVVNQQNYVNEAVAEAFKEMQLYMKHKWISFDKVDKQINALENRIMELEDRIKELEKNE